MYFPPAALPCVIAHGPPASLMLVMFLAFLVLGAVLPPVLYLPQRSSPSRAWRVLRMGSGVLLNGYGGLAYANVAWHVGAVLFCDEASVCLLILTLGVFVAVEGFVFYKRRKALASPRP